MSSSESKSDGILDASLAVFCRYGFRKTSMRDIAEAAGISRAAVYLHFKNKEEVFRAGSIRAHGQVMHAVERELSRNLEVFERIEAALSTYFAGLLEDISASAHGSELFDANVELVGDVAHEARQRLVRLIATALSEADHSGEIKLAKIGASSEQLATLIFATIDGLKNAGAPALPVRSGLALQLQMMGASLGTTQSSAGRPR
ncbi:TetR/AcrR family transcriptional regulator [Arthrobacter sp. R4-81]